MAKSAAPANPPWSDLEVPYPAGIPTMITPDEKRYLGWLGREYWRNEGDILEFGPWLGGSTWCLAWGMRASGRAEATSALHAVDNFRWREFMNGRGVDLPADTSFRSVFEENLAAFADLVRAVEARLPDEQLGDIEMDQPGRDYDSGLPLFDATSLPRPLEILFVDGAKSLPAWVHALRSVHTKLTPSALLVLQDYKASHAYWVPLIVEWMLEADASVLRIEHVLPANTVAWRSEGPLATAVAGLPASLAEVTPERGVELIERASGRLLAAGDPGGSRVVALSAVPFLAAKDEWHAAVEKLGSIDGAWPMRDLARELEAMGDWLARKGHPPRRSWSGRRRRAYHRSAQRVRRLLR